MAITGEIEASVEMARVSSAEVGRTLGGLEVILGQIATLVADRDNKLETLSEQVWGNVLTTVKEVYEGGNYPEDFANLTSLAIYGPDDAYSYLQGNSPFRNDGFHGLVRSNHPDAQPNYTPSLTANRLFDDMKLDILYELGAANSPVPASIFFRVVALAPFYLIEGEDRRRDPNFRTHIDNEVIKFDTNGPDPWGYLSFQDEYVEGRDRYY